MKKLLTTSLIFLSASSCFAIEEITLPKESLNLDYISDVYYGKAENQKDISPVFKLFTQKGLEFENSKINSVKASFVYSGQLTFLQGKHQSSYLNHNFNVVEPMITVKFNDNKSKAMFDINLTRTIAGHPNSFTEKINQIFVSHDITPNQTILIGQGDRIPNTFNGALSTMAQEMVLKSQLGRTIGDYRSVGIRNIASYKYLDYDIGLYDSTRFMRDFGQGIDFAGCVLIKPFADVESDNLDFKFGAAYNIGEYYYNYNQYSLYSSYDNKNFHIKAEYANADGYNNAVNSQNKADGFYVTASYDINPKFSLIGRYDYFTPNKAVSNTNTQEYTAGITYKPYKNMKIMLNYVRRNYSDKPDSNMLLFATRFII